MRKTIIIFLTLFIFFAVVVDSVQGQVNPPVKDLQKDAASSFRIQFRDLVEGVRNVFSKEGELATPVFFTMTRGVNPVPVAVFELDSDAKPRIPEIGELASVNQEAASEGKSSEGTASDSDDSLGEVWGARIDRAGREVQWWFSDSNMVLLLLAVGGLVVVGIGAAGLLSGAKLLWEWLQE
ncbi:MAG: hypothetical protein ACOC4Z_03260 [Patescibacteria group bacterium]